MHVQFIGIIKGSQVLVKSEANKYYVFTSDPSTLLTLQLQGSLDVSPAELSLASYKQILTGRHVLGTVSANDFQADFHGVVSQGKNNVRVLLKVEGKWFTGVVPAEQDNLYNKLGSPIPVDRRSLSPARQDQIDAGLGLGTLQRKRR